NHLRFAHIRLLSEAEWEYLARNGGIWTGAYPTGVNESNLHEYAWYYQNSDSTTHPVAELKPLIIFGHPFYDLLGNVAERVEAGEYVFRGGSWGLEESRMRIAHRYRPLFHNSAEDAGLRLAEDPP